MALLRGIRALLHEDGYQLKGVQKILRDQGIAWVRDRGHKLGSTATLADNEGEPHIPLHDRALGERDAQAGPLFETATSLWQSESVSPAAGILLRRALVKLETARQLLDQETRSHTQ